MEDFNIGDVVQLKIGGPLMMVYKIEDYPGALKGYIFCKWMDNHNRSQDDSFHPVLLKKVEKKD